MKRLTPYAVGLAGLVFFAGCQRGGSDSKSNGRSESTSGTEVRSSGSVSSRNIGLDGSVGTEAYKNMSISEMAKKVALYVKTNGESFPEYVPEFPKPKIPGEEEKLPEVIGTRYQLDLGTDDGEKIMVSYLDLIDGSDRLKIGQSRARYGFYDIGLDGFSTLTERRDERMSDSDLETANVLLGDVLVELKGMRYNPDEDVVKVNGKYREVLNEILSYASNVE